MKCERCNVELNTGLIKVGDAEKKEVTVLNNDLYLKAKEIMMKDDNQGCNHIGLMGLSAFIDWLEENYKLGKKK